MLEKFFDKSKTKYWQERAMSSLSEMRRNKKTGLFPKSEGWRNVVEHELVEAEAADVLAEKLGLAQIDRKKLRTAVLLHDVFKRIEIEKSKKGDPSSFDLSAKEQSVWIRSLGYPEKVVQLTESVGHTSLQEFSANFNFIPMSRKIIHYVDDITLNNDIVPLDVRIDALEAKPQYRELNEQGRKMFGGRPYFEVQREISKRIEQEFAPKLRVENPSEIPAFIKECITSRIDGSK